MLAGGVEEVADRVHLAGGDHVIAWLVVLDDHPHRFGEVRRVTPVAFGVEVSEVELLLQAGLDADQRARDLARHEGLAAPRGFVIKKDAIRCMHPVRLAVVHRRPEAHRLRYRVRTAWVERRVLALRRWRRPEHLGA